MKQTTFIFQLLDIMNHLLMNDHLTSPCVFQARSDMTDIFEQWGTHDDTAYFIELDYLLVEVKKQLDFFYKKLHDCLELIQSLPDDEVAASLPLEIRTLTIPDLKHFILLFHTFDALLKPDITTCEVREAYFAINDSLTDLQMHLEAKEFEAHQKLEYQHALADWLDVDIAAIGEGLESEGVTYATI